MPKVTVRLSQDHLDCDVPALLELAQRLRAEADRLDGAGDADGCDDYWVMVVAVADATHAALSGLEDDLLEKYGAATLDAHEELDEDQGSLADALEQLDDDGRAEVGERAAELLHAELPDGLNAEERARAVDYYSHFHVVRQNIERSAYLATLWLDGIARARRVSPWLDRLLTP